MLQVLEQVWASIKLEKTQRCARLNHTAYECVNRRVNLVGSQEALELSNNDYAEETIAVMYGLHASDVREWLKGMLLPAFPNVLLQAWSEWPCC